MDRLMRPDYLYKYRDCRNEDQINWVKQILNEDSLYFAPADSFNDPFEFQFQFEDPVFGDFMAYASKNNMFGRAWNNMSSKEIKGFYKDYIKKNPRKFIQDVVTHMKRTHGVLCLSTTNLSINLWSHYGGNHEGLCLEFSTKPGSYFSFALPVRYIDEPIKINYFRDAAIDATDLYDNIVFSKNKGAWDKEGEFRIVSRTIGLQKFARESLRAIYLGCNFKNQNLIDHIRKSRPDVNVFQILKDPGKYSLLVSHQVQ
jgi:hypothetical protein